MRELKAEDAFWWRRQSQDTRDKNGREWGTLPRQTSQHTEAYADTRVQAPEILQRLLFLD
jgi:hypothetical protein